MLRQQRSSDSLGNQPLIGDITRQPTLSNKASHYVKPYLSIIINQTLSTSQLKP